MVKRQKLFCEISPIAYKLSVIKCKLIRYYKNAVLKDNIAKTKQIEPLPVIIYSQKSLIRRKLGNVDMRLQENKAINLNIAAPKVNGIIIKPDQLFSFWSLVGNCTKHKGYKEGLIISSGDVNSGTGGGMCQFTNLIYWLILHTPMKISEHHHHDGIDMFPDFGRQIPFGMGTSIMHNYLDFRFQNATDITFQLIVYTTDKYLCGEVRAEKELSTVYHIKVCDEYFSKEGDIYYRNNKIFRECIDKQSQNLIERKLIKENHAKVMYDSKYITSKVIDTNLQ